MARTWRFSKLEFRNSVSMRALLYGKFIEAYKYIAYCSYVLTCKIWINVLLEKDSFAAISVALQMWLFNAFSCGVTRKVVRYKFTGFTYHLRDCISVQNVNKPWLICFIANFIAISKRCANREAFSTQRFSRCLILWGERGLHNVQLYIQLLPISRFV